MDLPFVSSPPIAEYSSIAKYNTSNNYFFLKRLKTSENWENKNNLEKNGEN